MSDTIILKIPSDVADMIIDYSMDDTYQALVQGEKIKLIRLLTFGYLNTGIIANEEGRICAYVTQWQDKAVMICLVENDECYIAGDIHREFEHFLNGEEALELFKAYNQNQP